MVQLGWLAALILGLVCPGCVVFASCCDGDAIGYPRQFVSPHGEYVYRSATWDAKNQHEVGELYRRDADGCEHKLCTLNLVNVPIEVIVPDGRPGLVTLGSLLDRWPEPHALVVYGACGQVLADYALTDLFMPDEIRAHKPDLVPPLTRFQYYTPGEGLPSGLLILRFDWRPRFDIDVSTGKRLRMSHLRLARR